MKPAEKITAAIQRLEQLKADSTPGGWVEGSGNDGDYIVMDGGPNGIFEEGAWVIGDAINAADVPLIVTLHRSIDAQLTILRAAQMDPPPSNDEPGSFENALALAAAILGEST